MKKRIRIHALPGVGVTRMLLSFLLSVIVAFQGIATAPTGKSNPKQELLERRITVHANEAVVRKVLNQIEKQADVRFVFSSRLIQSDRKVSLNVDREPLDQVLETLLKPLRLTYELSGNLIILNRAPNPNTSTIKPLTQRFGTAVDQTVTGTVSDEAGKSLPGVTVTIKGTTRGTTTDANGAFFINVAGPEAILVFSFVGYQRQEVTVGNQTTIQVALVPGDQTLNEVVVVGYGTVKKRDLTGSVASIGTSEIKAQPLSAFNQALQGRVPGVQVTQSSNSPGGGVTIRIRGGNSISASNDPLYVIDGFPVTNPTQPQGANNTASYPNILATINPNDIESIEVLKDASATAIYGSRGANGVVLITTRRGKEGQTNIDFDEYYGVQSVVKMLDMGTAAQHTELKNEQLRNLGFAERYGFTPQYPKKPAEYGEGTNWQKEIFQTAPVQNYQLTFSGGTDRLRYLFSGNYFDQQGIVITSRFKRYTGRLNLDAKVSNRLKIGTTFTVSRSATNNINEVGVNASPMGATLTISSASPVYDAAGAYQLLNVGPGSGFSAIANPVAMLRTSTNLLTSDRILANVFGELTLMEGLTARVSFGADLLNSRRSVFYTPQTLVANTVNGYGSIGTSFNTNLLNENTLTYSKTLNANHSFDAVAGITFQSNREERNYQEAQDFPNYTLGANNLGLANRPLPPSSQVQKWGLNSYLGRVNYRFKDRYLVTLTGRIDGSSRFGANNKYGFFPSGALAWRVSDEPILKNTSWLSDLKLRVSYGLTGNDGIGLYNSLSAYATARTVFGDQQVLITQADRIANPDLRWEKTAQFDAGFDFGVLNNRLQLTADYYIKTTTDLLLSVELPATTGFQTVVRNIGSLENRGFEIGLNTVNVNRAVKWTTAGNVSYNRNKILKLADANQFFSGQTIVRVGESIGSFYGSVFDGIWQTAEEIKAAGGGARTGDLPGAPRFKDVNGDGVYNEASDRTIIGNGLPKFIFGLTNTVSYKGFDLSVFLQGVQGNQIYSRVRELLETSDPSTNQLKSYIEGAWRADKPSTTLPSVRQWRYPFNSFYVEDGSFLRVKNVVLGYQLPLKVKSIRRARVYISGQNLLTFTKYRGFDPEVNSDFNSNTQYGFDFFAYPPARTYTLGATLNF